MIVGVNMLQPSFRIQSYSAGLPEGRFVLLSLLLIEYKLTLKLIIYTYGEDLHPEAASPEHKYEEKLLIQKKNEAFFCKVIIPSFIKDIVLIPVTAYDVEW